MIKLQNGGAVREVETQREADYYAEFGYKVVSQDEDTNDADSGTAEGTPEDNVGNDPGDDKKSAGSKKSTPKEE
jgi:hypothetical protein